MTRNEFVKLSVGIVGGLGIPGIFEDEAWAEGNASSSAPGLDESYLAKGLTGMAQSDGWFPAHLGAAVLAGYYLCRDNNLNKDVVATIKSQIDALISVNSAQFAPLPEETPDAALIEKITMALVPAIDGGLRAHGHAVIFASLSTKALRDAPQLAQPKLIGKLCGHSGQIARMKPKKPGSAVNYSDSQAMIEALFDNLMRFESLLGRPSIKRPNFTHMTTHTEALLNLELMGYGDLARKGFLGQQAHISEPVPAIDPASHPGEPSASLEEIMSGSFWENEENLNQWNQKWDEKVNPNGYWVAFGHLFKVLYSYHRLVQRVEDKEKVRLCSRILLERYFNPNVLGG